MVFHGLKYTYVGKIRIQPTNAHLDQKHSFFPCKFADLQFADWTTKEICGFVICGLIITNLRFRDLQDWLTQENLRICDCGMRL
jgi:hypothetical protein